MVNQNASRKTDSPKALLAEDDSLIRELVAHYLAKLGYEVSEAANGAAALEILDANSRGSFDLIVTDLLMPKANGATVIEKAKAQGACQRFLIMSGNPAAHPEETPAAPSDYRFIEKPFTFSDFESKLHSLVDDPVPQGA